MKAETEGPDSLTVPGPYTSVVTSNIESMGMKLILWNDTACRQWITTIDTDGCQVVPSDVSV